MVPFEVTSTVTPWIVQSPIISGSTLGKFHANLIQVQYIAWQISN